MQPVCLQCTGHINPQLVLWFKMIGMHREEWGGVGGGGSERRYDKELWEKRGSTSQMHIALLSTQPPSLYLPIIVLFTFVLYTFLQSQVSTAVNLQPQVRTRMETHTPLCYCEKRRLKRGARLRGFGRNK